MKRKIQCPVVYLLFVLAYTCFIGSSYALTRWESESSSGDVRVMLRAMGTALHNPNDSQDQDHAGVSGVGRLLVEGSRGDKAAVKLNLYQTYVPASLNTVQTGATAGVERSAALDYSFSDNNYVHLAADQISVRWSLAPLDITMGRQAINLANTFYFTPNDFFGSFAAQTFFRVYKPGVDAIQVSIAVNELSLLSFYTVFGYRYDPDSSTGWSASPDSSRISHLGRITFVLDDREWGLLAGVVKKNNFIGGSMTAEFFNWLGVRAEAHVMESDFDDTYSRLAIGFEHRWENSFDARMELFYNGSGKGSPDEYTNILLQDNVYLGRRYLALGFSYEFTPLLIGQMVSLANIDDHSWLVSANSVYSLSDESELAFSVVIPGGEKMQAGLIRSEYGASAYSILLEWRRYY